MDRRDLLKTVGVAALGLGASACGARTSAQPIPRPAARSRLVLSPVDVSWDRVIRSTVGLRPHRPSGFVLRAERLDQKTLIHHYGHGGSGMSLSWGTAALAADLALAHSDRRAAVIGCGVTGLTAARQLQRRGFDVTIYTKTVPPDTTSNMSLASFTPTSGLVSLDRRTPEWDAQFRQAVDIAYRQLQLMVGPHYGVSWLNHYTPTDDPKMAGGSNQLLPDDVQVGQRLLEPGEHPFPTRYAVVRPSLRIEPTIYLDALMRDVLLFGGHIVIRSFDTPKDLMALTEPIIVNSAGLGAKALFSDDDLVPLKGQLTVLIPQPEVTYATNGGARSPVSTPGIGIHMMPRSDGIVLGGTSERDVWTLDVSESDRQRIVNGHMELFAAMRPAANGTRLTRVEPPIVAPRVEAFFGLEY